MKLVTIDAREVAGRPGVLLDSGQVLDLTAAPASLDESQWIPQSTISILAAGERGLEHARDLVLRAGQYPDNFQARGALTSLLGTALMIPMRRPGLILVSDSLHGSGGRTFIKNPNAALAHGATIRLRGREPVIATPLLAAVVCRELYFADAAKALGAIAAWTLAVELGPEPLTALSAGDWHVQTAARQFPGSLVLGPALVTDDEIEAPELIAAEITVNAVVTASSAIGRTRQSFADHVAALSRSFALRPGDVVAVAAPANGAAAQKLHPGDRCRVSFGPHMELAFALAVTSG